jgi:hypothetical protein
MELEKNNPPAFTYWHVWTDENGISHQEKRSMSGFSEESMGGKSAAQWNLHLQDEETHIMYTVLPAGWVGEWHENPRPQWIIPLSGRWFVETMDGQRVEMGPGDISFGADQHCLEHENGKKGHRSGTVGDEPALLMLVQLLDDRWLAAQPGDLEK